MKKSKLKAILVKIMNMNSKELENFVIISNFSQIDKKARDFIYKAISLRKEELYFKNTKNRDFLMVQHGDIEDFTEFVS